MKLVRFENCIPVKGANRSLICDLQRGILKLIPNSLYEILIIHNKKSIEEIKHFYNDDDSSTIDEYISFLLNNEFAFLTDNPEWFPSIDKSFYNPNKISNAIFDITDLSYLQKGIKELTILGAASLQLRIFSPFNRNELEELIKRIKDMKLSLTGIEILISYQNSFTEKTMIKLMNSIPALMSLVIFNSPFDKVINHPYQDGAAIRYIKKNINTVKLCGKIRKNYFTSNLQSFTESLNHNSCLNRKISIDVNGDIKNCPSMPLSYGNIKDTTLEEALNKPGFKKYWNITKDDIEICKDCEFRHVCTDCRAYTERTTFNKEGLDLSKPLKCGYNPYTNEWAEWSTNPLKEKAIEYYGMQELVKKRNNKK